MNLRLKYIHNTHRDTQTHTDTCRHTNIPVGICELLAGGCTGESSFDVSYS
jgi:hypothetical protein